MENSPVKKKKAIDVGDVTLIGFDPSAISSTNVLSQMFLRLKSAQEAWWNSTTQNRGENKDIFGPFTDYLDVQMMLETVKSNPATVKVKIYKAIESGDDIATVKSKLSNDSTVNLLIVTNQTDVVGFASSYLGDPCQGVVCFSKNGHVSCVALASSLSIEQQKYIAQRVQTQLNKSDVDRALESLVETTRSTEQKINDSAGDLNAALQTDDIERIGRKWSAAVNDKYPTGYDEDRRLRYDVDSRHATISISDVAETCEAKMLEAQNELKKNCDAVESESQKANASKNDF